MRWAQTLQIWGHAEISLWIAPRQIDLLQKHSRLQTVHFCIRLRGRVSSGTISARWRHFH
jgi:hypothetical protein